MIWVPIPGYTGYFANENGEVGRPYRSNKGGHKVGEFKVLVPSLSKCRPGHDQKHYLKIHLGRKNQNLLYHRLIALTFLGPAPFDGAQVDHMDGDKKNNRPSNLR